MKLARSILAEGNLITSSTICPTVDGERRRFVVISKDDEKVVLRSSNEHGVQSGGLLFVFLSKPDVIVT